VSRIDSLVLSTVNASYSKKLDAMTLVQMILEPSRSKTAAGPMSSFFYDVSPKLQLEFAKAHGISVATLKTASQFFDAWSGMKSRLPA
jgi:hypothetical protein